jgi:retron-type reverse transcriptase
VGQVDLDMVKKEVETIRYLGKMFKVGDIVRVKDKSYRKIKKVLTLDELVANLKKLKTDKEIDSYLISLDFSPNPSGEMLTRYSRDIIVNKKEEMVRVDVNNYHSSWEIIKEVTLAKGKHKWDIS